MRRALPLTIVTAAGIMLSGCGHDATAPLDLDFTGDYAVQSMEFTSIANPQIRDDLIRSGVSADLLIQENDSLTVIIHVIGQPTTFTHGAVTVSTDSVTMDLGSQIMSGTWSRSGKVLSLDCTSGFNVDIDGDGVAELSRVRMKLKEQ
jgi:hypothetical protein